MGDLQSQTLRHYSTHFIETIPEYIRDCRMQEYPTIYGPDIFLRAYLRVCTSQAGDSSAA